MIWSDDPSFRAPGLPAVWLVATAARPTNRTERSQLRRDTARAVLARQSGLEEDSIGISHLPSGQPLLSARPDLHLSLATRGGVVAVGLAAAPIGVDIEAVDPQGAIPQALLHPQERQALLCLTGMERAIAFALIWAAKEAYVKALGIGLVREPESFAVSLPSAGRFAVRDHQRPGRWDGHTRLMRNGGQIALAAAAIILEPA